MRAVDFSCLQSCVVHGIWIENKQFKEHFFFFFFPTKAGRIWAVTPYIGIQKMQIKNMVSKEHKSTVEYIFDLFSSK